jgi:hypothetical protein
VKNNLRLWVLASVLVIGALLAGGWFVGAQPLLAAASSADASAAQLAAANQATQIRIASLAKEASDVGALQAKVAVTAAAVPATLDANAFVDRVNALAHTRNVAVQSVTPGTPQAYTPPAAATAAAAVAAAAAQPAAGASPAPTAGATPAPAVQTVPVLAATDPSITGDNFTVVPMTVAVKGTMENTLRFVHDIQHDQRLYLVSSYGLSAEGQSGGKVVATLTGFVYALHHA